MRTVVLLKRPITRVPMKEPTSTPRATGVAMTGWMSPRPKYTPALAAAVRPIMKLLVAVETFMGRRITVSIASTLKAPLPMPSRPDSRPAPNITAAPARTCTA